MSQPLIKKESFDLTRIAADLVYEYERFQICGGWVKY